MITTRENTSQKSDGTVKKTSPRVNSNDKPQVSSNDDNVPNLFESKLEHEDCYKKDDLMTEEDTDMEEETDEFLGLTHESLDKTTDMDKKKTEYDPYHPYSTSDIGYHPTSAIFEDKEIRQRQQGYLNTTNNNVENILEDNLYERKSSFSRRPSQLQQEMTSLNALCPPSHVLKARRLSKNTPKTSVSSPIVPSMSTSSTSTAARNRKPSIVENYSKEFSSNSAVSPRFMALRKLSEVTALPSNSVSYSSLSPPGPQAHPTTTGDSKETSNNNNKGSFDVENRVLARVDDIIETQLQFHLGQIVWRASENHLDARRFWEEQKKEMFGFAATLIDRMETQIDMQRRMTLDSITSPEEKNTPQRSVEESDVIMEILRKELKMYKSKYTEAQSQLFELEMLKTRNSELEKQHVIDTISLKKQWEDRDSTLRQLNKLEQERVFNGTSSPRKKESSGDKSHHTKVFNLETQNKQLKAQVKQMQEINRQLLEEATAYELNIKKQNKELKQIKNQLSEAELVILNNKRKMAPTSSAVTTTTADGIDCSEDFGKKQQRTKKKDTWADIMESEDEAKKSADEWAKKYHELQASYFEVCLKFEKKDEPSKEDNTIDNLNQTIIAKDEEIRHLKQAENVNRIQIDYLQLELDKNQRKNKPGAEESKLQNRNMRKSQLPLVKKSTSHQRSPPTKTQPISTKETGYVTEDGYLTFTTEINGQPSKYTIKIPSGYQNSAVLDQKKMSKTKTKFNPDAQPWASSHRSTSK